MFTCSNALNIFFPDIVTVLKGHSGLVKGVTWDPVGKYLASQSDDKTLRVWRTSDWQQETFVSEPFADCSGTTHVLRLSWSPDGHYVVSAHAMNNSGPVAKILERDGWKMKMDFVGHRKAVTCVVRIVIYTYMYFLVLLGTEHCCCNDETTLIALWFPWAIPHVGHHNYVGLVLWLSHLF